LQDHAKPISRDEMIQALLRLFAQRGLLLPGDVCGILLVLGTHLFSE
jgi:hypothetical protein